MLNFLHSNVDICCNQFHDVVQLKNMSTKRLYIKIVDFTKKCGNFSFFFTWNGINGLGEVGSSTEYNVFGKSFRISGMTRDKFA